MKQRSEKKSIAGVAALLLLAVYAAGILSVLLSGAGIYQRLNEGSAQSYDRRTCVQYLVNKVRQAPSPHALSVAETGSRDTLVIGEWIDGAEFCTRIYCHNGWLMEQFTAANAPFEPEAGEGILPAQQFTATCRGSLLELRITDSAGQEETVLLTVRGGEAAEP